MPQSLVQMPEIADVKMTCWYIKIRNHKVVHANGLIGKIIFNAGLTNSDRRTFYKFEKHGISFECAVEYCAREIEKDVTILTNIIWWVYEIKRIRYPSAKNNWLEVNKFSESGMGRNIAEQFIEKIRSCENWGELYDEMHPDSEFHKEMKNKIIGEIKQ